jgi:heat shock protein HtpX
MKWFKRVGLFLLTNLLVMTTISIVFTFLSNFFGIRASQNYISYLILFSAVWGMGGAFISLLMSKMMAKWMMSVQVIDPQTTDARLQKVLNMTHMLARKAGIEKMPEVGVYDSPEINAFATGPTKNHSLVAVSTGLLQSMDQNEVEGVLGHEIAHVANGDMVTMTLIQGIVNAFVLFFSRIVANILSSNVDERYRNVVHMLLTIVFDIMFTILGSLVVSYFSRTREFRADRGGATFAGRSKMIAGLRRLKAQFEHIEGESPTENLATLKISSKQTGLMALFSTHPSLDERIQALERAQIPG